MSIWDTFTTWLKARLHIKPTELRGTPGVSDPAAAASHVNETIGGVIDFAGPSVVENALMVHPDQLKGAPGISDHAAAAGAINAMIAASLAEPPK